MKISEFNREQQKLLQEFVSMSQTVGSMPDCIQAGGGNTSIKIGDIMAVKCSGCQLKDMTENFGFVCLPYKDISKIYIDSDRGETSEKDTSDLVNDSVIHMDDLPERRPSVEAGFHALLGNAVIHSHAVYANIFNCIKDGQVKLDSIMKKAKIPHLFLPFINPGAELAFAIIDKQKLLGDKFPHVIFLKNHGLIVWADTAAEALELNTRVLDLLKNALELGDYPNVDITNSGDCSTSNNHLIKSMIANHSLTPDVILHTPLYPDQLVYLNANLDNKKLELTDTAVYNCTPSAAYSLEETLLAYAYLLNVIRNKGFEIDCMPSSGIRFILGWDAEKYRQQMLK